MTTPTTNHKRYLVAAFRKLPAWEQIKLLRQAKHAARTNKTQATKNLGTIMKILNSTFYVEPAKQALLMEIDEAIRFRDHKGTEYPQDKRNEISARALRHLEEYVQAMDESHQLFELIKAAVAIGDDEACEEESRETIRQILGRIGFDVSVDPAYLIDFLGRVRIFV